MFDTIRVVVPLVIVPLLNQLCELHAWGRAPDGWWALVVWRVYAKLTDGHNDHVHCSAWIPATQVQPSRNEEERRRYPEVKRIDLRFEQVAWPLPARPLNAVWHHYGAVQERPAALPGLNAP